MEYLGNALVRLGDALDLALGDSLMNAWGDALVNCLQNALCAYWECLDMAPVECSCGHN